MGSRVPQWPTRLSIRARRAQRTRSWDVGPEGLSSSRKPSVMPSDRLAPGLAPRWQRFFDLGEDSPGHVGDGAGNGAAGGVLMPSAAEADGDLAEVHLAFAAEADLHLAG